jgi:predicted Zn-dependent protease
MPVGLFAQSDLRESQADMLGLGYMTNAGYDPQALVSVFEHWRGKFGPGEEVRARALALSSVSVTSVLNTSTFDEIKTRLAPRPASSRRLPTLYK